MNTTLSVNVSLRENTPLRGIFKNISFATNTLKSKITCVQVFNLRLVQLNDRHQWNTHCPNFNS